MNQVDLVDAFELQLEDGEFGLAINQTSLAVPPREVRLAELRVV